MGSKYPVLSPQQIIKVLGKLGLEKTSQKGSHIKYTKTGNPTKIVIIPMHYGIVKGTLKSILEQAGITLEEFLNYL